MYVFLKEYFLEIKKEWSKDQAPLLAAAQAFYYLLSIVPMLILIISILPYFQFQPEQIIEYGEEFLPAEAMEVMEDTIIDTVSTPNGGLLTFGIIGTIWSASNGMNAFIMAINTAYNVKTRRTFIKHRALSILMTLLLIFSFLVSLTLPIFGQAILDLVTSFINLPEQIELIFQISRWVAALIIITLILSILYKVAPNMKIPFKKVLPGALIATVSWMLASFGFSLYISNFGNFSATYGGLGGIIILMLWFFLTGAILLLGAEINAIHYRKTKGR
ncbi:YihY/virulence factor BrkB family protein [Alkalicoccus daliensis]|uniref:Membrane protein n=1 Tax=Alkalicoccus daliensis TaxID=745820 RepID=A0A1H0ALV6_9BACI|nr:YihY/virulence factor BrkB family protein [Alkalicoccus daliensis]SDN34548.1 membrane protein [Alkalicoccus daliensis]